MRLFWSLGVVTCVFLVALLPVGCSPTIAQGPTVGIGIEMGRDHAFTLSGGWTHEEHNSWFGWGSSAIIRWAPANSRVHLIGEGHLTQYRALPLGGGGVLTYAYEAKRFYGGMMLEAASIFTSSMVFPLTLPDGDEDVHRPPVLGRIFAAAVFYPGHHRDSCADVPEGAPCEGALWWLSLDAIISVGEPTVSDFAADSFWVDGW